MRLDEDGCIFWIGHDVFNGPPGTLNDSVDNVAVKETPAAAFSSQKVATRLKQGRLKIKAL